MVVKSCFLAKTIHSEEDLKEYTEKLNCKIRHKFVANSDVCAYVMEDAIGNQFVLILVNGQYKPKLENFVGTRIVVDDIQEGIEFFKKEGYETLFGPVETESNFVCTMSKGNEYRIIFEHKHNN